ncbi:hypothetical protein BGZ58_003306, partial [Dissophora ornata]
MRVKTSALRHFAEGGLEEENNCIELYLNHLYVAVTRARKHLVIITPAEDRTHIMTKMLKLSAPIKFKELRPSRRSHSNIAVLFDELSVSDDLRTAIVMRERGLLQQALNVFNVHKIRSQVLFTQAQIYWTKFLEQEDAQDLQKAIVACGDAIEASLDRTVYNGLFEVGQAQKLLAQMFARDGKYCKACVLLEKLGDDCQDILIACLVDAIKSESPDLHDIRDIILPRSHQIRMHVGDIDRFAGLVSILTASWGESMLGKLLADIPHMTALIAMHNVYARKHRKVFPVWNLLAEHVKTIDFSEWNRLRRLDDFADFGCMLKCPKFSRHFALMLVFVSPGGSDNIDQLYQKITSRALMESCKLSGVPILSVAVQMRALSAPLRHFVVFSKQVTHSESRLGLLAEAYKTHRQEMCGSDLQLELFRWCANMCGGIQVIETLCTVLLEDDVVLKGIYIRLGLFDKVLLTLQCFTSEISREAPSPSILPSGLSHPHHRTQMELLNDTRALRILFNADQRIKGHDRVETFPKKGFSTVQGYIDRLIEMCSYEFKIAAAAALFDKVPDNPMRVKMQKTNIKEASLGTSYYIFKEVDALLHNDIVVLAVQESTDIAAPKRYIGFVSGTKLLPTRGQCCYTITFGARLKDFEDDQTMWVVGNLTSYLRVFESLEAKKSMGSLPGLLLKPPILDLHSIDPVNIDPEFTNNALNIAQNQAVSRAIQSGCDDPIVLVQGPPGCGKSTTISTMVTTLVAQGGQVLSCAQTNVAIIDLAYKYMTSSNFREFDCLIDMKLSKIADDQKRDKLAPKSVEARFHGVVNAVLHVVRLRFRVQPVACFGSVNNDAHDINSILYESYQQCIGSGIFQLLPSEYTRKLFCAIRSAVDDRSSDLKLIMKLIIGMRVEIAVFFRTEAFNGLLETCRPEPEANNKPFPIYTWVRQALLSEASAVFCTINIGIAVTS